MGFNLPPKRIVLGIDTFDLNQIIRVKRGFIGSLTVQAAFIGRDKKVFIIPTGTTAKVRMLKPDQKKVLNDTEQNGVVEGNAVTFKITDQMQAYPGEGALEIILFNGGETVTSSTCGIEIKPNVHDDSGIESTDEWLTVINTLAQIEEVVTRANQATEQLEETIENAEEAAQAALSAAGDVTAAESYSKQSKSWAAGGEFPGDSTNNSKYFKEKAEEAKAAAEAAQAAAEQARNEAEEIVGIGIASETNAGIVKGGGNVIIATDGQMNVDMSEKLDITGDAKDTTVTFVDTTTDAELTSGSKISIIIGLIKSKLSDLLLSIGTLSSLTTTKKTNLVTAINELVTSISGKIDESSISTTDTENSTTKVAAAAVAYQHGIDITNLKAEEDIAITFISGVTGKCYKNNGTGLIQFTITISTPLANPTLVATLPSSIRPATTQVIKGVAKQTSGFGRCNLSIDTDGYVQLAAIDINEPMNDLTFTSFWK